MWSPLGGRVRRRRELLLLLPSGHPLPLWLWWLPRLPPPSFVPALRGPAQPHVCPLRPSYDPLPLPPQQPWLPPPPCPSLRPLLSPQLYALLPGLAPRPDALP